ncbi:MAG TPA: helix-turn-helix domain-containing protein [Solirubrobacteraceae bacterium]|jgi:hypothetical protein
MPDIGATLHEARLRRKVDIVEVEAETKIRARYLRALEEEEWDLLPGPTYVKTFLRTYGEYLGLDAKLLVEEYKQRFERPTAQELTPFSTNLGSRRERRRARGPVISPGVIVAFLVVLVVGGLAAVGILWGSPDDEGAVATPTPQSQPKKQAKQKKPSAAERRRRQRAAAARRRVRFQIVPTGAVSVCLESAGGRALVPNVTLAPGAASRRFTGKRFKVSFGNGLVRMRVNGKSYPVPATDVPLGYDIRPGRAPRRLSEAQRPTCT